MFKFNDRFCFLKSKTCKQWPVEKEFVTEAGVGSRA